MPIKLVSAITQERKVALCPTVTLLPIRVSRIELPRLDVADRTTVPSCKLLLSPTVILPSSPVKRDDLRRNICTPTHIGNHSMCPPFSTQPYQTEAC